MPWPGAPRVNMQAGDGGKAKPYQVRQVLAAIDLLLAAPRPAEPAAERSPHRPKPQRKRR